MDGTLAHAGQMQDNDNFDASASSLLPVQVANLSGLIFVRMVAPTGSGSGSGEGAPNTVHSMEAAKRLMDPQLSVYELHNAKIAYSTSYRVNAGAVCVFENNRECWHCPQGHPDYIQANYDTAFIYGRDGKRVPDPACGRRAAEAVQVMRDQTAVWNQLGLPFQCTADNTFAGGAHGWFRCSRQPLRRGWVTESLDGQPVCQRLLGRAPQCDLGSLRIHVLPNYWLHVSGDHAVSTRLTPISKTQTECKVDWLVHAEAVEDRDYTLQRLLPFWQRTSEQDWALCEMHQQGVLSSAYRSGPLSRRKEAGLVHFLDWYVSALRSVL